jgi:multidrug efflux system membrane fusion protein
MSDPTPNPTRQKNLLVAGATIVVVLSGVIWGVNHARSKARAGMGRPAVLVTIASAQRENVDISLDALGTVTPLAMVTLTSRVTGVLTEVHYREGQMVKQNDLLAVVDPRPYDAALLQAQGQLARDEAMLANAKIDRGRYQKAFLDHAIPEQQLENQEAVVSEFEGIVKLDQGNLDAAQVNVEYTRIVSPIDGRVGLRLVDPGNIVTANGTTPLVTIAQIQPITVIFTLSQDYLATVAAAMGKGRPLKAEAFDRTKAEPVAQGQLLTIDNQVDPATGTIRLRASFPNENQALWPGEFVHIRLVTGTSENAVTVPERAVQRGPDGSYLFVVKPDMTAEMRTVEVGQLDHGVVVIRKGLAVGERVVVDGQYGLEQGSRVTQQAAAPGG